MHYFFESSGLTSADDVLKAFKKEKKYVTTAQLRYYIYLLAYNILAKEFDSSKRDARRLELCYDFHPASILFLLSRRTLIHSITEDVAEYLKECFQKNPNGDLDKWGDSVTRLVNAYRYRLPKAGMRILQGWIEGRAN